MALAPSQMMATFVTAQQDTREGTAKKVAPLINSVVLYVVSKFKFLTDDAKVKQILILVKKCEAVF